MSTRASDRHDPPTRYNGLPRPTPAQPASARMRSTRRAMPPLPPSEPSRSTPSGNDACSWPRPSATRISSRLPPPRSPTMPSASGIADSTPSPAACASCAPDNSSTDSPRLAASLISSSPFVASRTAAVATVRTSSHAISLISAPNRRSAAPASAMASASIVPICARLRPSPASTFSLNSVAGNRAGP